MRPWDDGTDSLDNALRRVDVAFEFMTKLGVPYYCFHDRDVAPEGSTLRESHANLDAVAEKLKAAQKSSGIKLLWGTANLFSNPRFMHGAATSPNADVFAYAAAQVRKAIEVTHDLGGENYVFWGGREGYMSSYNTDMKRELDHLARFMHMANDYAQSIGFKGQFLFEPKPKEPTKHQYDFDAAACLNFIRQYGLLDVVKLNIETNHATLAGHSMMHELEYASIQGVLGSIDANTGDLLLGWDTDQFPTDIYLTTQVMLVIMKQGGLRPGGTNFDAKVRRESIDPIDLFYAHIGGMDAFARGLKIAAAIRADGILTDFVKESLQQLRRRYRPQDRKRHDEPERTGVLYPRKRRSDRKYQRSTGNARKPDQSLHLDQVPNENRSSSKDLQQAAEVVRLPASSASSKILTNSAAKHPDLNLNMV